MFLLNEYRTHPLPVQEFKSYTSKNKSSKIIRIDADVKNKLACTSLSELVVRK